MLLAKRLCLTVALLSGGPLSSAPTEVSPWPKGVALPAGEPIDEEYRSQFGLCDSAERFRGHQTHGCGDDPNQVTALRRLPDGSVAYVSKLAVDLDGSPFACGPDHGRMDQCPTTLMLPDGHGGETPVDADRVPYVVIPAAGPPDVADEFSRMTGVGVGDFGVVLARGRVVPVIVADTGPYPKLGEGSLALHRALGRELCTTRDADGVCRRVVEDMESIGGDVTTVLFPGTARRDLTPATVARIVRERGTSLWAKASRSYRTASSAHPAAIPKHGIRNHGVSNKANYFLTLVSAGENCRRNTQLRAIPYSLNHVKLGWNQNELNIFAYIIVPPVRKDGDGLQSAASARAVVLRAGARLRGGAVPFVRHGPGDRVQYAAG